MLDAGCGTGRVTAALVERLPDGRVIAVDGSPAMVEQARSRLPAAVDVREADLLELELEAPVDAIVSTATFHWISDHDRLFTRLREALVPGGRSSRSAAAPATSPPSSPPGSSSPRREPFAEHLADWPGDWNFASPGDTEARLLRLGFTDVWCWSTRVDVELDEPAGYLAAICLGSFLERLPEELHEPFIDAAVERLGAPLTIEYVRLNILARRAASA